MSLLPPQCRLCRQRHDNDMPCAVLEELAAQEPMATEERIGEAELEEMRRQDRFWYPDETPAHSRDAMWFRADHRRKLLRELEATRAERDAALEALAVCGRAGCPTAADFAKEAAVCKHGNTGACQQCDLAELASNPWGKSR